MGRKILIDQALLDDADFDCLSKPAKLAWFVFRFDTRIGISGIGRMAPRSIRMALDSDQAEAEAILKELEDAGWIQYDRKKGVLWFVNSYRLEPNSPKIRFCVIRELLALPKSEILIAWLEKYGPTWPYDEIGHIRKVFTKLGIPYRYPIDRSELGSGSGPILTNVRIGQTRARVAREEEPNPSAEQTKILEDLKTGTRKPEDRLSPVLEDSNRQKGNDRNAGCVPLVSFEFDPSTDSIHYRSEYDHLIHLRQSGKTQAEALEIIRERRQQGQEATSDPTEADPPTKSERLPTPSLRARKPIKRKSSKKAT